MMVMSSLVEIAKSDRDREARNLHASSAVGGSIFAGAYARKLLRSKSKKQAAANAAAAGALSVGSLLSAKAAHNARKRI